MNRLWTIIILFELFVSSIYAQLTEKQELAFEYFRNKEYEKAADLFNELYQNQGNKYYLTYYISSLLQIKQFNEAEKMLKKEIKKKPDDYNLRIMLGNVYKQSGNIETMKKIYDDVLKSLNTNQAQIFQAANAFIMYQEYSQAEAVYLKGQKMLKGAYRFHLELASLYQIQKMYEKMIDEYIALLLENPQMIQTVQNRLQQSVYTSEDKTLTTKLQEKLILQTQKNPDATIMSELLIWLYIQQMHFSKALKFSIALDKRNKEDGSRIYTLAQTAFNNKDYTTALKAYQYLIDKGTSGAWYFEAKNEYLVTLYQQTINNEYVDKNKIIELENLLHQHIEQNGINKNTFSAFMALIKVKAFYLNKTDESIDMLRKVMTGTTLFSVQQLYEAKLLLADLTLMKNDIWEATILYTQVEKNNGNEPIAAEAKFKKALLAYYSGDFLWAQAQMDVLKASTSKLIANDALALSQFISDNIENDSTQRTLKTFSNSDFYSFKHQDSLALLCLDSILENKDAYSLYDDALLRKGDILIKLNKIDQAVVLYDSILNRFKTEVTAPQAAYKLANIYQYRLQDIEKAKYYLEIIFTNYPGSFFADEARKRYRILRGDLNEENNKDIND